MSIWLTIAWAVALLVLFLLVAGCEKDDEKCGAYITDDTGRLVVKKEDIASEAGNFFFVTRSVNMDVTTVEFTRDSKNNICDEENIYSEASAWVYTTEWPISGFNVSGYLGTDNGFAPYTFIKSGAGANTYHYLGSHDWYDLQDGVKDYISYLSLEFPYKGSEEADINYLVDSLKLQIQFKAMYNKLK